MTYFGYTKEEGRSLKELKIGRLSHFFSDYYDVINLTRHNLVLIDMGEHIAFFNSTKGNLVYYSIFLSSYLFNLELENHIVLFFQYEYAIFQKTLILPLRFGYIHGDVIETKISADEREILVIVDGGEGEEEMVIKL